jgi:uncharacterized LabA/DUF88 family protein
LADTRLKIAVFIDFDNIEIGVKSTLGVPFDIGCVLDALKERGDVVSKIAYGDWTRAGDYSRSLTQHATKLVQRNLTPGGDKNGADINLALDALEMAFTHSHINAYVIVGGDSDFITLVEKLKQYDKQIFVVGGRSFTSMVMQRNCHEFIAYENLVGSRSRPSDRGRQSAQPAQAPIEQVAPLVRRALKVLSDREVSPQLGLLKSTLLQLDSTFSERTYGTSSFRDFAEKLAAAGHVTLRQSGRDMLVELREEHDEPRPEKVTPHRRTAAPANGDGEPAPAGEPRAAEGIREVRRLFQAAQITPRWPMYVRQAKQFLRNVDASFDERKFGFATPVDLLRACQREGLFRIERDRHGVMRLFPGTIMQASASGAGEPAEASEPAVPAAAAAAWSPGRRSAEREGEPTASSGEAEVVDGAVVQETEAQPVLDVDAAPQVEPEVTRRRRGRGRTKAGAQGEPAERRAARKPAEAAAPARAKRVAAKPPRPRPRGRKDAHVTTP